MWVPPQPESDKNGVPIVEGCTLRRIAQGGLLPGYTAEGIARRIPGDESGLLYIQRADGTYINAWNKSELEVQP